MRFIIVCFTFMYIQGDIRFTNRIYRFNADMRKESENVLTATRRMRGGTIGTKSWSFVGATMSILFSELCKVGFGM